MTRAYLSLGGNIGDTLSLFAEAIRLLEMGGAQPVGRSRDFATPPWGKTDQAPFINGCLAVETALTARELLALCLATELSLGRHRLEKWGPRSIDIDILVFGDERHTEADLKIPHPFLAERAFVLVPLADLAPDLVIDGQRVADLAGKIDATGIKPLQI